MVVLVWTAPPDYRLCLDDNTMVR